ncbi:MAG TPA: Ig-like domain-containing protein, partial [Verrucomicrobiae bacterium]|nr:Ig-like domain-containing protein [Verrucomicrobiae bacterium]
MSRRLLSVLGSAFVLRTCSNARLPLFSKRKRPLRQPLVLAFRGGIWAIACCAIAFLVCSARAYDFAVSGINFQLQEVTSNLDVYFTAMRFNTISNEWDVDVTISNKSTTSVSVPLMLLVDRFSGTEGTLRPDGVSTNKNFYDFSGQVANGALGPAQSTVPRTIGLGFIAGQAPKLVTRLFSGILTNTGQAIGFARSLNGAGQPLAAVTVTQSGPSGSATNLTDSDFGVVTLGQAPGLYTWQFSFPGYLPVWRQATLQSNSVTVIPYPWLAQRSQQSFTISPLLGGAATNDSVAVQFAPGSAAQNTTAQITELSGQTLPAFLPQGWSPVQAFWLELRLEPSQPVPASLTPWGPIANAETAALVQFSSTTLNWQVLQLVNGNGTNAVAVQLPGSGAYALVLPDALPVAPPAAAVGLALQPSLATINLTNLTAGGILTPGASPASLVPELVTAAADLRVTNASGALPSGTLLRGEVSEHYLLNDGTTRTPPMFDESIVAYQRPGAPQTGVLHAQFPMRPVLLFGPDQLNAGTVHMDIFPRGAFAGGVLDTNAGVISSEGLRLLAAPGVLDAQQAVELRRLSETNFTDLAGTNFSVVAAFQVALGALPAGKELFLQSTGIPPNMTFVLARVLTQQGLYGLEPRERLHSDASGTLTSDEPATGDRLPGLSRAGEYLLLAVQPQQGLVEGVAKNASGVATGRLPVRITGQPWLTFSASDGSFKLLAPAGNGTLAASNPATGDSGNQAINVPVNLAPVISSVSLGVTGLQVASITPADTSTNVPQVTSVVITFNRPVNPATLVSNAVQLLGVSNQPVAANLSLNLANTTATLLPGSPLDPATLFTVLISTNIADSIGRPFQGQAQFTFTTVALPARDPAAQLIIYEPGATNLDTNVVADLPGYVAGTNASLVVVHGTPGCADPAVPVIIVNEGTGETGTVLSKQDGSFTSFVPGQEQDFISATFVSLNGARVYVPVNRQLFDDGTVGLYPQGGALQALGDNGPIKITIPQNALSSRAKFKLAPVNPAQLQAQVGVVPTNATVAGGALKLQIQGAMPTLPLQVSFPVNLLALGYPTNEAATNAAAALAVVETNQDVATYQVVDQMFFKPQTAATITGKSRRREGGNEQVYAGLMDTGTGLILGLLPGGQVGQQLFNCVMVPLLFGPRPVVIKGKVGAVPTEFGVALERLGDLNSVLNLQTGNEDADTVINAGIQAGIIKSPTLGPGQVLALSLQALQQLEVAISKPLSGAFIALQLSGGPLNPRPGRIFPGMVYATSGSDGTFLMVAPAAGAQYLVNCTHPLFSDLLQEPVNPINLNPFYGQGELSLSGVVFHNFLFTTPLLSQTPSTVNISFSPEQPAAGQPCQVLISAFEPAPLAPMDVHVGLVGLGTKNLLTGQVVANPYGVLTNTVVATNGNYVRWSGTLFVSAPVTAALKVYARGATANQDFGPCFITNQFTGPIPQVSNPSIPPPDTNDVHGPLVIQTDPVDNGFLGENASVNIVFNKPIDAFVTNHLSGIVLSPASQTPPILRLSPDQQTLTIQYSGLTAGQSYTLTLSGHSIRDLANPPHPLDQVPSTPVAESFLMRLRTPPATMITLPSFVVGSDNGRGSAIVRNRLYVLDQASQDNYLLTYDITTPLKPQLLSKTHLYGQPRDLAIAPLYRYVTDPKGLFATPPRVFTNDLIAVVGGDLDAVISQQGQGQASDNTTVGVRGQYLWVMNMADPANPQILASPIVSYRVGSAVTKVRWAPPYLVFQEFGADIQRLGLVNLQEMLIGFGSTPLQQSTFPAGGKPGVDLYGNGEYVDPGDTIPLPDASPTEFYGLDQNYVLQGTTQKILDFSVTRGASIVGVTLGAGLQLDPTGKVIGSIPPSYRTLALSGPLNVSDPTNSLFSFGTGAYPRWVTILDQLQLQINNSPVQIAAAVVSLQPDTNGVQTLAVLDISLPEQPKLVNKIPIPDTLLGGAIESVTLRSDGQLEVAGQQNTLVLDPSLLAVTNTPPGQLHPSILDVVTSAGGTTRSVGSSDFGVHAVADNGRALLVQSPPQLTFVSFPQHFGLVDPVGLHQQGYSTLTNVIAGMRNAGGALAPARFLARPNLGLTSDLEPPNPALHFYVLAIVPGGAVGANQTIELGLESLNPALRPLSNLGTGFAPVRAVSADTQKAIGQIPRPNCGAPIRSLTAYRVTDDPLSPFYNYYLSRPFALITESIQLSDLARVKSDGGTDREILFSGYGLRAFLDPTPIQALDSIVGPFTAKIDPVRKILYPLAVSTALSVNRSYLTGDNPPPNGGGNPMEDSYGTILSHSGEVRTSDPDFSLPSPRMPINIIRSIGNQDNYEGPFGVGWDFNYNQRLMILDPLTFPAGLQMPLVERDTPADSEIAGSQDVLFNSGEGQVYHFTWQGTNMPPEYAKDPLVNDPALDYQDLVSDYYLPEHGMFNLLVRFKDGRFERMTPGGVRYRYRSDGRLETILDRYPSNRHDLTYDPNDSDKLIRIDDNSVSSPRFLLFGYYRQQNSDPSFTAGLDMDTSNPFLVGKICRIQDYTSPPRDVLFQYSADGFLTNRSGIQVNGENGGFSGRSQTYYSYQNCQL